MELTRFCVGAMAIAAASITIPEARASEPARFESSSEWKLLSLSDKCRITRKFGESDHQTTLQMDQVVPDEGFNLTIIGDPVRNAFGRLVTMQFGPGEASTQRGFITAKSGKGRPALVMFGARLAPRSIDADGRASEANSSSAIGPQREKAISELTVSDAGMKRFTLELGSMEEPLAQLRACSAQLWDQMREKRSIAGDQFQDAEPVGNPGAWVTGRDYPKEMLWGNAEALVRFRLIVNLSGRPTSCSITQTSRPQMFDDAVCLTLLKRARFKPARDADGNAVVSSWSSAVRFEIR